MKNSAHKHKKHNKHYLKAINTGKICLREKEDETN